MTRRFDKDRWIKNAIARGYIKPQRDGTILRCKFASTDGQRLSAELLPVKYRTHKKSGRVYFNLTWLGITKSVLVNRVIALCFLPNPLNLPQVNHIDGEKQHNWVDDPAVGRKTNLEWATGSENEKHAHQTGLKSGRGSANSNARLTPEQVLWARASDEPVSVIAKKLGVGRSTVTNIRNKTTWKHI